MAVDLGGSAIKAELLDDHLEAVATRTAATPAGSAALDGVAAVGRELLAESAGEVVAAGIAVPGIVDPRSGRGLHSVNLGWRDVSVRDVLSTRLGLPVAVEHDVTAAGRAEWLFGAGRGVNDLLVMVIGTGIAAVVVAGGRLVRGGRGQAGELGHVPVVSNGPVCVALLGAISLLGCTRVVVGGGLAEAGDALLAPLRERLIERRTVQVLPDIVPAAFGLRAGVIGAGLAARDLVAAESARGKRSGRSV